MAHKKHCECEICNGVTEDEVIRRQSDALEKTGWYAHYVFGETPDRMNIHTHGLRELFDHPDLQIVFPLPQETAHGILTTLCDRIKAGEKFKAGDMLSKVIRPPFLIRLIDAQEGDRDVLRLVFPDKDNNIDEDTIQYEFKFQFGE